MFRDGHRGRVAPKQRGNPGLFPEEGTDVLQEDKFSGRGERLLPATLSRRNRYALIPKGICRGTSKVS